MTKGRRRRSHKKKKKILRNGEMRARQNSRRSKEKEKTVYN